MVLCFLENRRKESNDGRSILLYLEALIKEGNIQVMFRPFLNTHPDEPWIELTDKIKEYGIKRLVIDLLPALISRIGDRMCCERESIPDSLSK